MIQNIKNNWKNIIIIITLIVIGYAIYMLFFSMSNLPKGDYISSLDSPNKEYTLKSYLYNGGATVAFSVRVELINNKTKKIKNIYWKYKEEQANMKWLDDNNIEINNIKLNIHKDIYDWRRN